MPVIWGKHDKKQIFLDVAILKAADLKVVVEEKVVAHPREWKALIDTGATTSCISKKLASDIGLSPIGKIAVHGVSGIQRHNCYLFYVGFTYSQMFTGLDSLESARRIEHLLQVLSAPIQGVEFDSGPDSDVLLGMDVLSNGSLKIEGDGTFSWAW